MYSSTIILIIVFCIVILYVYFRYNLDAKNDSEHDIIYREKLDISASEAAYLLNKNSNSLDLILADILTLVEKGYIKIETKGTGKDKTYIFEKEENAANSDLKNHEMSAFRLFFKNKDKVVLSEFIKDITVNQKSFDELEEKMPAMKNELEFELRRQNISDATAEKKLLKFNRMAITLNVLFVIMFILSIPFRKVQYIEFASVGILLSMLLYKTTGIKEDKLTKKGAEVKKKAQGFKRYLKEYVISDDKPLYMVNILEYNYIMAVAFGMAELGQEEFIQKEYSIIKIKTIVKDILSFIIVVGLILVNFFI